MDSCGIEYNLCNECHIWYWLATTLSEIEVTDDLMVAIDGIVNPGNGMEWASHVACQHALGGGCS